MASKDEITVGAKVKSNIAAQLKARAFEEGVGVNTLLRRMIAEYLESDNGLRDICFLYGIEERNLIKNIQWLFDSGKLFVRDGKLKWNPKAMTPEYFSLDDKVESMRVSEREKDRIKKMVADNLDKMSRSDDLGNGAGV